MNKFFLSQILALLILVPQTLLAQSFTNTHPPKALGADSRYESVPNQLIFKLADRSILQLSKDDNFLRFLNNAPEADSVNTILSRYGIISIEQLCPQFVFEPQPRTSFSYCGRRIVEHDLSQLYLITLDGTDPLATIQLSQDLAKTQGVDYAEPNYLCHTLGKPTIKNTLVQDPLQSLQWGISATRLDSLFLQPKLDSNLRRIIAILDAGIDITHADLSNNIWTNYAELSGAPRQDDDNNGFRDDIHGWDFVRHTAATYDYNHHGTHCAGIAAASANNGIGISGANPDALIMPVTVAQSDGSCPVSTLIQGINYAAQNHADVISISLGTYSYSSALEQALSSAFQNSIIVAAAGNDALPLDTRCDPMARPCFPAAFSFVLGVQATQQASSNHGHLAPYSNFDCDGPNYSQFSPNQLYNYEISAPGTDILSTIPGGQYQSYSGTSMACPLVAGGITALMDRRHFASNHDLIANLINLSQPHESINFMNLFNSSTNQTELQLASYLINDTLYGDSSAYADAGERIQFYPSLRTLGGTIDSIVTWLEFQPGEDSASILFHSNHTLFGQPLSPFEVRQSINPIEFTVSPSITNGRQLHLTLCAAAPNSDTLRQPIDMEIANVVKLGGLIYTHDTLWPTHQYQLTRSLGITVNASLVIMPGTTIRINDGINLSCSGQIKAMGTPDSIITFTSSTNSNNGWYGMYLSPLDTFSYCIIENMYNGAVQTSSGTTGGTHAVMLNCIFRNNYYPTNYLNYLDLYYCNIYNNRGTINYNLLSHQESTNGTTITYYGTGAAAHPAMQYNNFCLNRNNSSNYSLSSGTYGRYFTSPIFHNNNIFNTLSTYNIYLPSNTPANHTILGNLYLGSTNEEILRAKIWDSDYPTSTSFFRLDLGNVAQRPVAEAHGIVWKVEVNGFDAQDQFDSIAPLGIGTHEFKIYFNRAMDTSIAPTVTLGIDNPYKDIFVSQSPFWSSDSTAFTVHLTLSGHEDIDGTYRIAVTQARDNEHFEIPDEYLRFNVPIQLSGSLASGLVATAGIGQVNLSWPNNSSQLPDLFGYNLYRYTYEADSLPTASIRLNTSPLHDTSYTDYAVTSGTRYFYYYKTVNTSFTEVAPSSVAAATPLSSLLGDANGNNTVDVADVITTINYMTFQNPQPFIFNQADVNYDNNIDILDIVGIINIILYGDSSAKSADPQLNATYTLRDGTIYIDSPVDLAGFQFYFADASAADIQALSALKGFEIISAPTANGGLLLLAYSFSGRTIPAGTTPILAVGNRQPLQLVLSDIHGHNVVALNAQMQGITDIVSAPAQIMRLYPNPANNQVNIDFSIGNSHPHYATLTFTDCMGRTIHTNTISTPQPGQYSYTWQPATLPRGIYFVTLSVNGITSHTTKVVLN
ncbi:MAG: S8 family serine peptidase [Bacteroidales bacterium]|nr:S8 family serine peptidase [Bacteroidales bacterium]